MKNRFFITCMILLAVLGTGRQGEAQENAAKWNVPETDRGISSRTPLAAAGSDRQLVSWGQPVLVPSPTTNASEGMEENVPAPVWRQRAQPWQSSSVPYESPSPMPSLQPISMPAGIIYPKKAIRRGWEGKTVISAEILPDGFIGQIAVAHSSGHEILDAAALESIKTWKFEPLQNAGNVSRFVDIPVTFRLKENS